MIKSIHNPELFREANSYVIQWLERVDSKTWHRRTGRISDRMYHRLLRMDVPQQLDWIAKMLPESVEIEQPEPDEQPNLRRMGHER